jgi:hypothetical protein
MYCLNVLCLQIYVLILLVGRTAIFLFRLICLEPIVPMYVAFLLPPAPVFSIELGNVRQESEMEEEPEASRVSRNPDDDSGPSIRGFRLFISFESAVSSFYLECILKVGFLLKGFRLKATSQFFSGCMSFECSVFIFNEVRRGATSCALEHGDSNDQMLRTHGFSSAFQILFFRIDACISRRVALEYKAGIISGKRKNNPAVIPWIR